MCEVVFIPDSCVEVVGLFIVIVTDPMVGLSRQERNPYVYSEETDDEAGVHAEAFAGLDMHVGNIKCM
jgi:hypothetical protein